MCFFFVLFFCVFFFFFFVFFCVFFVFFFLNCVDPLRCHSLWLLVGLCTVSCMYGGFISAWMEISVPSII